MTSMKRTKIGRSRVSARKAGELVVVLSAHHDAVEFYAASNRPQSRRRSRAAPHPDPGAARSPQNGPACSVSSERLTRRKPGRHQARGAALLGATRWSRARCRRSPAIDAIAAINRLRSRLTSGSPPVSRIARTPTDAAARTICGDLFVAEDLVAPQPRQPPFRHAIDAAQIALVGDRNAQIGDRPAEAVDQRDVGH